LKHLISKAEEICGGHGRGVAFAGSSIIATGNYGGM